MAQSEKGRTEVPVADAATRLRMTRERVIRLIQTGRLRGRRDPGLGWLVDEGALEQLTTHNTRRK
jgi:hypothetical protein